MRRTIALFACICLTVSGTTAAWGQTANGLPDINLGDAVNIAALNNSGPDSVSNIELFLAQADTGGLSFDITAPTIAHTPSVSKGIAGEMQSIVAEINDNQSVQQALLIYRTSSQDFYSTTNMSADATNTTWLATIDTTAEDEAVYYYILAEDTDGNRVQKGSESNPLTLELQQPAVFSTITPVKKNGRTKWLAFGLGVFVVGALLAAGSSGGSSDDGGIMNSDDDCCTITFVVPNVTTE